MAHSEVLEMPTPVLPVSRRSLGTYAHDKRVDLRHRTVADQGDQRPRLTNGRNRHDLQADRRRAHTRAGGQRGRPRTETACPRRVPQIAPRTRSLRRSTRWSGTRNRSTPPAYPAATECRG